MTSASDIPDGVVSNPDGRDGADGNGGDLVRMSHPGIVQVQMCIRDRTTDDMHKRLNSITIKLNEMSGTLKLMIDILKTRKSL